MNSDQQTNTDPNSHQSGVLLSLDETRQSSAGRYSFGGLLGRSPIMQELFILLRRAADTEHPVLITGEPGTGKEVAAMLIHRLGSRRRTPLMRVDLNKHALQANARLYGWQKDESPDFPNGLTGALELAFGGTLLLDQAHRLTGDIQEKLSRTFADGGFVRNGGTRRIPSDSRIMLLSEAGINELRQSGTFVSQLIHHPDLSHIHMPPLRDHREDIPVMLRYFLVEFGQEQHRWIRRVSESCLHRLNEYHWPCNVREFRNVLRRAVMAGSGDTLLLEHLPPRFQNNHME